MMNSRFCCTRQMSKASSSSTSAASIAIVVDNGEENENRMDTEQGTPKEFTVDEIAASSREREFVNPHQDFGQWKSFIFIERDEA